jgi:hypothetical protein
MDCEPNAEENSATTAANGAITLGPSRILKSTRVFSDAVNAGTRAGVALECAFGGVGFVNGLIRGVLLPRDFCFLQTIHIGEDSEKEAR